MWPGILIVRLANNECERGSCTYTQILKFFAAYLPDRRKKEIIKWQTQI
jgi:hypothetical protein